MKSVVWFVFGVFLLGACTKPKRNLPIKPLGEIIIKNGSITNVSGENMPVTVGAPSPPGLWKAEVKEGEFGYRLWHGDCTGSGRLLHCAGGIELIRANELAQPVYKRYQTPQAATTFEVALPYVYVAWCAADILAGVGSHGGGLEVFEHSAGQGLREVSALESNCIVGMELAENRAYLATWRGLTIVDVSQPTRPIQLGTFTDEGFPHQITISGHLAYVSWLAPCVPASYPSECRRSLRLLDVSNPSAITEVWSFDLDDLFHENPAQEGPQMTVHDGHLYVPLGTDTWQVFQTEMVGLERDSVKDAKVQKD